MLSQPSALFCNIKQDTTLLPTDFDLFQRSEKSSIAKIKTHLEAEHDFFDFDNHFFDDLNSFKNLLGIRRIYLWAALLKEGVAYSNIYKLGLHQMPTPVGYATIPVTEEILAQRKQREIKRLEHVQERTQELHYFPLCVFGACRFDELPKMIDFINHHAQYSNLNNTVNLLSKFGDGFYSSRKYKELIKEYGNGAKAYNLEEDLRWITSWRNTLFDNISTNAANYPDLVEKINLLKMNKLEIEYLGACVRIKNIGNIHEIIQELHIRELKKLASSANFINEFLSSAQKNENVTTGNHM